MYNVTNDFHEAAFGDSRQIAVRVVFDSNIEVDGDYIQNATIEEVVSADGLAIGSTCSNKATINMYMPEEDIPLTGGWFNAFVGVPDECPLGKFYITDVVTKDKYKTVTITAYDKMCHLGKSYTPSTNLTFPAKVAAVVADIATQNGFEVAQTTFPDYEVDLINATEREMIGYIAGLMGKNAKFDRNGKLAFVWFTDTDMDIPLEAQYQDGFAETTVDSFVLGGLVSGTSDNPLTAGEGRTITFSNPFMTQGILDEIFSKVQGFSYTPCELKYRCDPSFETGDIVDVVDDDEGVVAVHATPIMAQTIKIGGGLNSTIYAYGVSEESVALMVSPSKREIEQVKNETAAAIDGIEVGARNLIRASTDMIFADYYFYEPGESTPESVTWNDEGDVTLYGATATYDEEGNVTVKMKSLTVNGVTFEVVDEKARKDLADIQEIGVTNSRIEEVTLLASEWVGSENSYSQVVSIAGITEHSQVDLTPSVEQLLIFYEKDLTFMTENDGGVVTVYVVGQKPQNDYTIQVTITEVSYD